MSKEAPILTDPHYNYNIEARREQLKANIMRNKLNNKVFKINEEMTEVYRQNIAMQRKLDSIKVRAVSISNLNSQRSNSGMGNSPPPKGSHMSL
jgi:hypothetical protein